MNKIKTGLSDKKGDMICDGDILKNNRKDRYTVYYSDEHLEWYTKGILFRGPLLQDRASRLTIVHE